MFEVIFLSSHLLIYSVITFPYFSVYVIYITEELLGKCHGIFITPVCNAKLL